MQNKQYYVYIATNSSNRVLYTGVTNNLIKRMFEHKEHTVPGFTSKYNVNKLIYFESFNDVNDAIAREKQIKAGSRKHKFDLVISKNPNFDDLYDKII